MRRGLAICCLALALSACTNSARSAPPSPSAALEPPRLSTSAGFSTRGTSTMERGSMARVGMPQGEHSNLLCEKLVRGYRAGAHAVGPQGQVWLAGNDGTLQAFDAAGRLLWAYTLDAPLAHSLAYDEQSSRLLAITQSGSHYVFKLNGELFSRFTHRWRSVGEVVVLSGARFGLISAQGEWGVWAHGGGRLVSNKPKGLSGNGLGRGEELWLSSSRGLLYYRDGGAKAQLFEQVRGQLSGLKAAPGLAWAQQDGQVFLISSATGVQALGAAEFASFAEQAAEFREELPLLVSSQAKCLSAWGPSGELRLRVDVNLRPQAPSLMLQGDSSLFVYVPGADGALEALAFHRDAPGPWSLAAQVLLSGWGLGQLLQPAHLGQDQWLLPAQDGSYCFARGLSQAPRASQ